MCMTLTKLSKRLATIEANLLSPAKSEIRNKYSGALTWLLRCVRPEKGKKMNKLDSLYL